MSLRLRRLAVVAVLLAALPMAGCFKVRAYAPPKGVRMLSRDAPVTVHARYKQWYMFWGLWKITRKGPAEVIQEQGLTEARILAQDRLEDGLIGFLNAVLIPFAIFPLPQSVVIEGNR